MKIVKIILSLTLLLLFSNVIHAQEKPKKSPDQKVEKREELKQNIEKLQLSKEQKISFIEISKRYRKQYKELKDNNVEKKEKRKQIIEITSKKDEELKKVFSETQFKTYKELEKARREEKKEEKNEDQIEKPKE